MEAKIQSILKEVRAKNPCKIVPSTEIYKAMYQAGIKEVVEWAEANLTYPTRGEGICFERNLEWQAKLKEWGVK